jgi:DNA-nicking Smr family endonuclease
MFRPGDRVRFLNDVGEATVVQMVSANEVLVIDDTEFEYTYPVAELIAIENRSREEQAYKQSAPGTHEILYRNVDQDAAKKAEKQFKGKYKEREEGNVRFKDSVVEVDLHIHELVETEAGLDPAAMLDVQMQHFERMMLRAEREKLSRVVFIHGVGQGVLRAEIRKHLELYYPYAQYLDARYEEYGYGATEVRLRFN